MTKKGKISILFFFVFSSILLGCESEPKNGFFKIKNYSEEKTTFKKNINILDPGKIISFIAEVPYNEDLKIIVNDSLIFTWKNKHISSPKDGRKTVVYDTYWSSNKRWFEVPMSSGSFTLEVFSEGKVNLYYYGKEGAVEDARKGFNNYEFEYASTDIPVFQINTCNMEIIDDPKIPMTFSVFNAIDYNTENSLLPDSGLIEIRGFTSKNYGKQSYSIKSNSNSSIQENISDKLAEKIVLYGPYVDLSLIRNSLAFSIYNSMGGSAPVMYPVDLIINRQYRGVYYVTEKAKIKKLGNNGLLSNTNYKGGYLLEIDRGSIESDSALKNSTYNINTYFDLRKPKREDLNDASKAKIIEKFNNREDAIYSGSNCSNYFDYPSFIDHIILNEVAKNIDAYRLSTFIIDECLACDSNKYVSGPVWDFNLSFGLANYNNGDTDHGFVITEQEHIPFWWKKMFADTVFQSELSKRYTQLRKNELSFETINTLISSLHSKIERASIQNDKKWRVYDREEFYPHKKPSKNLDAEINKLESWLENRLKWLDKKWIK